MLKPFAFKMHFKNHFFSKKVQILNPVVGRGAIRVLSGVANLASHYDCSDPCSFRDITFVVIFFKKLELFFCSKFEFLYPVVGCC